MNAAKLWFTPLFVLAACLCSAPAYAADPSLSPATLAFGNQAQNTPSPVRKTVLTNRLSTALTITSITTNLADYTQTNGCPLSPSTLAAGRSCTISVTFTPAALGARAATLSVSDNASNSPQTVVLTGTGVAAATATPVSVTFANQVISTKSPSSVVTVKNNQSTTLTITSIVASPADYSTATTCPLTPKTVAAGGSCTISVYFTPSMAGAVSGNLAVYDSAPVSPAVALAGTGVVAVNLTPSALTFSSQNVGTTSGPQTVTVTNNQSTALTITSINSSAADFGLTSTCPMSPATLGAGASCTLSVTFAPLAAGSRTGTLSVNDDASTSPQTVSLSGTGVAASLLSIALAPTAFQIVIAANQQLTATGTYSDGSTQNLTASAVWSTSSSTIASVNAGQVTGLANGVATITASLSGVTSPPATADIGTAADFYVATNGNDSWTGKLWDPNSTNTDGPFATVSRAQTAVQAILANPNGRTAPVYVLLRAGNYYQQALTFTAADSGSATLAVNWQNYPNETPVLSGGVPVTGWSNLGGNTYQAVLPSTTKYFENLFYNGGRRLRPRLGGSLGTYYRIAGSVFLSAPAPPSPPPDQNCSVYVTGSGWECFDRFTFHAGDISNAWTNLNPPYPTGDIELIDFELWTAPKMRIKSVDAVNNIVYLTGPTSQAALIHGYLPNHRYLVENVKDQLVQPGQWFLDLSVTPWTLTYLAAANEDPITDTIVVPQSVQVMSATGLQYVTFKGLTFAHDNFTVAAAGYVSVQQDPYLPSAIGCYNCQHVVFDSDIIAQTAGGGIEFKTTDSSKTTSYNAFQNGALYDIGGTGIRIGALPAGIDTDLTVPQFTTLQNNLIEGYGRVIPTAVGIIQGSGHDNTYTHNDIYDGYHSGIEVCLPPSCAPGKSNSSGSFNNVASFNHIFDLYEGVTDDGGAIYFATGGAAYSPPGNQILNNKIHDTTDASIVDADGYGGTGIDLDSSTGLVNVENNLIYRVSAVAINMTHGPQLPGLSNTVKNNIFAYARNGMISNGNPYPTNVCPTTPTLIFNTSNNLFYFDRYESQSFYVQQGCEYSCGFPLTDMHNWQSNLYWRLDGGFSSDALAFHSQPSPGATMMCATQSGRLYYTFMGWQNLAEDVGGLANTNPGFKNAAYPYDDYSLPGGSPGVGFVVFDPSQAGRVNPVIKPTDPIDILPTFPTAYYNPATDY